MQNYERRSFRRLLLVLTQIFENFGYVFTLVKTRVERDGSCGISHHWVTEGSFQSTVVSVPRDGSRKPSEFAETFDIFFRWLFRISNILESDQHQNHLAVAIFHRNRVDMQQKLTFCKVMHSTFDWMWSSEIKTEIREFYSEIHERFTYGLVCRTEFQSAPVCKCRMPPSFAQVPSCPLVVRVGNCTDSIYPVRPSWYDQSW